MKLRSVELVTPNASEASSFMVDIWALEKSDVIGDTHYLRGSGDFPYLMAITEGDHSYIRYITFVCSEQELNEISKRAESAKLNNTPVVSDDFGGGVGIVVELPEGQIFRFLANTDTVDPIDGKDLPVQLTHVVVNAIDAEATADVMESVFGFKVSDRTKGMVFIRCNESHHSTALARAGFCSLNHVAFEMENLDGVMRGIGRLRDHGYKPVWGPGRHGPGDNVFAYFIAPFGSVVEFSTAVEKVSENYKTGVPSDWTWPENRIDQWGVSGKDFNALGVAERKFLFERDGLSSLCTDK